MMQRGLRPVLDIESTCTELHRSGTDLVLMSEARARFPEQVEMTDCA